ncbi:MAG: anti-sigma F factor [Eubacterium sp.]|nr:anti-sigma F factor [Eubacterium sp.]
MKQKISSTNRIEMTFPNLAENEKIGRTLAAVFAAVLDPTIEELCDFKTAVSEAVTNAIIHAYPDSSGQIRISMDRKENQIHVTVTDYGIGIGDIKRAMEPLYTTITNGERSGMGFTFMEAFSDRLHVISRPGMGTTVFLSKKIGVGG